LERSIGLMLSSPRKPPLEHIAPVGILAIQPPREVEGQLVQHVAEEPEICPTVELEHPQGGPGNAPAD